MATTKLTGRQLNFQGAAAFTGSSGAANGIIFDNGSGLVLSASRVYLQANPADSLEAATKAYVDSVAGGGVTANQIAFGNGDGSGVSSDAGLVYNPNTDQVGVSGSIHFSGSAASPNFIYGSSTDGLRLSGSKVDVTSAAGVSIDGAAASNFSTSAGALTLEGVGMDIDATGAGTLALDGAGGINIGTAADVAVDFNASTLDIDSTGALTIDSASTLSLDAAGATNLTTTSGTLTVSGSAGVVLNAGTALDIDAATAITIDSQQAGVSIDGAAASNFTTSAGALLLHGAGGINIGTTADVAVDVDSSTFDLDASGAITIDGTSTISIDAADDLNLTVTSSGAGEDLTISQIGGNDSSILITAAGTGTDAVSIDATAGSMVIAPSLVDTKTLTIGPASATQMVFTPHGTPASEKISLTNTAGTAVDAIAIAASAGGLALTAKNAASKFTVEGAVLTLSGSGVNIDGENAEVDITTTGALDLNGAAVTIDGSTSVVVEGAGASSFKTAAGDLTFEAEAANAAVVIKGDHEGGTAIHLDGNANAASVVDIDAGELDIDASGGINITSAENAVDAIVINASAGGIDITAAGAAGEDIDLLNSAGSVTITSGEDIADAIKLNITGGSTAGTLLQFGSSTHFSVQSSTVRVHENVNFLLDGAYLAATGSKAWQVPNYVHNSAVVTSGSSEVVDYGTVTAGHGISTLTGSTLATNGRHLGISLMTGSLRVLGGQGGLGVAGLLPDSLRVYQNGLLLASGSANDYEIGQYNFTSGSRYGFDVQLYTAPVVGDVFQVDVSAMVQADPAT